MASSVQLRIKTVKKLWSLVEEVYFKYEYRNSAIWIGEPRLSMRGYYELAESVNSITEKALNRELSFENRIYPAYLYNTALKIRENSRNEKYINIDITILNNLLRFVNVRNSTDLEVLADNETSDLDEKEIVSEFINLNIPKEFIIPIQQYLLFFKEFIKTAKGEDVQIEIKEIDTGIAIKYNTGENITKDDINNWCTEYINFFKNNIKEASPKIHNIEVADDVDIAKIDILRLKLENEVSHLKTSLRIAEFENKQLQADKKFFQDLTLAFATKNNVIHTQLITGGGQQFADKIKN